MHTYKVKERVWDANFSNIKREVVLLGEVMSEEKNGKQIVDPRTKQMR